MKKILIIIVLTFSFLILNSSTFAQTPPPQETLEAKVVYVDENIIFGTVGTESVFKTIKVKVTKGSKKGKTVTIQIPFDQSANKPTYKQGDEVLVLYNKGINGEETYFISDFVRRTPLFLLWAIFVLLIVIIGRWRGISSLIGMGISFLIIFYYLIPQILQGKDPVVTAVIASIFIIPITFFMSHGINRKTTVAVVGTLISLVITGILARLFVSAAKLTGFAQEEASFIQALNPGQFNMQGLLLAGIIIGVSGILDDITVSQSALIEKLHQTDHTLSFRELYKKGIDVGRDHIASLVNTLILVYAGASLPLMILFVNNPHPFSEIVNYEIIANEIVRTLVGSIGLILAVPITTLLSCFFVKKHMDKKH
ncbi:MAG TPA: YibE/F family protein [Candidatus Nitrosocosmicus sp.]|nr:YibE/F family protein [Candidatus Nitrosocosmicus sp.]